MADRYRCHECSKPVGATKNERYRTHKNADGEKCPSSSEVIPAVELQAGPLADDADPAVPEEGRDFATCPEEDCGRRVKLTALGYFEDHDQTLRGGDRCPRGGVRYRPAPRPEADDDSEGSDAPSSGNSKPSPESTGTPTTSSEPPPEPTPSGAPGGTTEESAGAGFSQPGSPFSQPGEIPPPLPSAYDSMSERGREIAARMRETFYAYTNRNSSDNRSAQRTLGPSEIGSPCDRQLAMKLLGVKPVNPQEGWAPFVGTAVHAELAKMFEWANGSGSGRYAVEVPLDIGSPAVPRGTADLIDRVLFMVDDHKLMGRWSLRKLREEGPSQTYRVQGQVYAYGAVRAGERVKEIAIVGWPRESSNLDDLYVHVEPYDPRIAEEAIARAERIQRAVAGRQGGGLQVAREFPAGDDCKWCPFHAKGDAAMTRGCPGK